PSKLIQLRPKTSLVFQSDRPRLCLPFTSAGTTFSSHAGGGSCAEAPMLVHVWPVASSNSKITRPNDELPLTHTPISVGAAWPSVPPAIGIGCFAIIAPYIGIVSLPVVIGFGVTLI